MNKIEGVEWKKLGEVAHISKGDNPHSNRDSPHHGQVCGASGEVGEAD